MDLGVRLQVDREAVGRRAIDISTEAEDREPLVIVVRFNNVTDVPERLLVLVGPISAIMERVFISRIAIAASVVDTSDEADLPAGTEVVYEGGWRVDFKLIELEGGALLAVQSHLTIPDLV